MNGKQLKNSILQLAIQGKLVPQDPADEPASELLKRIRKEKEALVKAKKIKKEKPLPEITDDEKPFEIPESWEWCRLGEISTYNERKQKVNAKDANPNIWGLDLEDIEKGGRLLEKKTVGERKAIGDKTLFHKGDVLYSKLRPYLLKILVAEDDGICTPEIVPFSCYCNIDHHYMVNFLKSAYVDDYINTATFGIKMPRVGTETMMGLPIPLPPLAEQKRIVAKIEELMPIVDEYDKAQTELDKLNAELPERLKKSVLQEAIQGRLGTNNPADEPASELLKRIRKEKEALVKAKKIKKEKPLPEITDEEKPFEIPENWEWCRLSEFMKMYSGTSYSKGDVSKRGLRILRGGNIQNNKLILCDDDVYLPNSFADEDKNIKKHDIIIVASTGSLTAIGKPAFIRDDYPDTQIGAFLRIIRPTNIECWSYIEILFKGSYYRDHLTSKVKGTNINNIKSEYIEDMLIPLPPLAEQKRIVEKLDAILPQIENIK